MNKWGTIISDIFGRNVHWEPISQRVVKVQQGGGYLAFKRWERSAEELDTFLHHLRYGERVGIKGITPLVGIGSEGYPIIKADGHAYYAEPWFEDYPAFSIPKETQLLTTLAVNHKLSEDEESMDEEALTSYKQQVEQIWQYQRLNLDRLADQHDQQRFISPFSLTFLNAGPFLDRMFTEGRKGFQKWARGVSQGGARRFVFCHGRPSLEHGFIQSDQSVRFTNWETSGPNHPAYDLAYYYHDLSRNQPFHALNSQSLFSIYESHGPTWGEKDTALLKALTLTPTRLLSFVEMYLHSPRFYTEYQWTAMLDARLNSLRYLHEMMAWKEAQETAVRNEQQKM